MKKIYLLIFVFAFFSVIPSLGMKVIKNDGSDRIVPSRSGILGSEEYIEEDYYENAQAPEISPDVSGYQGDVYEKIYKPVLGQNIRGELAGTKWGYAVYKNQNGIANEKTVTNFEKDNESEIYKPYTREAADYNYVDTNSKQTVHIGY